MAQKPLEGAPLAWMTVALSLATFMQVLDSTIANVAIPTIAGDLGSSNSQGTWVITSFGVANAISIPVTGWLAKRVGEVRLVLMVNRLVCVGLMAMRHVKQLGDAYLLPCYPGTGRWAIDPTLAKPATEQLSACEAKYGPGVVVDDDCCRPDIWADPRRLYQ